jgi:quercetin dioxygenase-like cupin family protein
MAVDLYQPFTNPITRETFRCISYSEESFVMEWSVHPGGYVPFEHVHVSQDEIFHVQHGEIRTKVRGITRIGRVGDTLTIPRGTPHIAFNDKEEALVCLVEYKPGLDHYKTMQCFAGLTLDCLYDRRGLVNVPKIMFMLRNANALSITRPAFAPEWFFRLGMNVFFRIGSIFRWETLYEKYTT